MMGFVLDAIGGTPWAVVWVVAQASMLVLLAGLATGVLRRFPAAGRHAIWAVALGGVLALPVIPRLTPMRVELTSLVPGAAKSFLAGLRTPFATGPVGQASRPIPAYSQPASPSDASLSDASLPNASAPDASLSNASAPNGFPLDASSRALGGVEQARIPRSQAPRAEVLPSVPPAIGAPAQISNSRLGSTLWESSSAKSTLLTRASILTRASMIGLLALWAIGFAAFALQFLVGAVFLSWMARTGMPAGSRVQSVAADVQRQIRVRRGIRVLLHSRVPGPMTWGVLRPVVLFPPEAQRWPEERLRVVLTHELAHVARMDVLSRAVASCVRAVHWFNPLVWWASDRMTAEAERACDECVIRYGAKPSAYADHLLALASQNRRSWAVGAAASPFAQRSGFEGRLLAILQGGSRSSLNTVTSGSVVAVGIALAFLVGSVAPASAAIEDTPIADAPTERGSEHHQPTEHDAPTHVLVPREASSETIGSGFVEIVDRPSLEDPSLTASKMRAGAPTRAAPGLSVQEPTLALDRMIGALSDTDSAVRGSIVRALVLQEDPRAIAALIRALESDSDAGVRESAAWALGQFEDPIAVPALAEVLRGDDSVAVRRIAAWALGQIEHASAVPGLGEALGDSDAEVRESAVWALGQIQSPQAVPFLEGVLSDEDAGTRRQAVWALGQIESEASVPALVRVLRDPDSKVRSGAVWALGQIESPSSADALTSLLSDDEVDIRRHVVWALGQIEDRSSVEELSVALSDPDAEVRSGAAWAIGQIEPTRAPDELVAALRDSDPHVRQSALWALSKVGDSETVTALRSMLDVTDTSTRIGVIQALGAIRTEDAVVAISDFLSDTSPEVRQAAARALAGEGRWVGPRPRPHPRPRPRPRPRPGGLGEFR